MLIDKAEIERVKRTHELVSFVRRRGVTLTQRGKQLVALCIFHDYHVPTLDAKKQLWNCLGACREGGDVYRFCDESGRRGLPRSAPAAWWTRAEMKAVGVADQQWLERAVEHHHARLLETPAAQDYLR